MSKQITLKYYSDPGHAWVAVKVKTLFALDVLNRLSIYSYIRGKTVYAEYHCDAGKVVEAFKAAGYEVNFDYNHTDKTHPIRSYNQLSHINIKQAIENL